MASTPPKTLFQELDIIVKVYDPEKKEPIAEYPNYKQAGLHLGIKPCRVSDRCHSKKRIYSPKLDKEVALRLAKAS